MSNDHNTPASRPYCNACGYDLSGLTDSSKCPECGGALVDVLMRPAFDAKRSIRFQSQAKFLGLPVIAIAAGRYGSERYGHARGIIAIGDVATGLVAIGAFARGVVTIGACGVGLISLGSLALGAVAIGGISLGMLSTGGVAVGAYAFGGVSIFLFSGAGGVRIPISI